MSSNAFTLLAVGGFFMLLGLNFALVSLFAKRRTEERHARCTASGEGRVTRVERDVDNGTVTWTAHIEYQVDGHDYEKLSTSTGRSPALSVPDRVAVAYDPLEPKTAYLPDYDRTGSLHRFLTIFGLLFVGLGIGTAVGAAFA